MMFSFNIHSQTIYIDSTFTQDGEISPFSPNETIYGISVTGTVYLHSDTSLIRIIVKDENNNEFMIYEAYSYIISSWNLPISLAADETKYRELIHPLSIKIQLTNAYFSLKELQLEEENSEHLDSLQNLYKQEVEREKVNAINNAIERNQMLWFAGQTPVSGLTYVEKLSLFGEKYNLCGLDYYVGGIYDDIPGCDMPEDNSPLVEEWDWRNRHGADDPGKKTFYYDGDISGSGWLTSIKDQGVIPECSGLCYIYGPLAAIEGVANVYFNHHVDYDLSEQHVLDCDEYNTDECIEGFSSNTDKYVKDFGVVDDTCYPRDPSHGNCRENPFPQGTPAYRIMIAGSYEISYPSAEPDDIKMAIITHGPLKASLDLYYNGLAHIVALIGYGKLKVGDIIHENPDNGYDSIVIDTNSPYLGQIYWIYKNSWGTTYWGDQGYMYHANSQFNPLSVVYYELPIKDTLTTNDVVFPRDADKDGYWNWGISESYPIQDACSPLRDSDDSENRLGPFDDNYYSQAVNPEMEVYLIPANNINHRLIKRNEFFSFTMDELFGDSCLKFVIENPGSAQLNLEQYYITNNGKVEIINVPGSSNNFSIDTLPKKSICMGSGSEFQVNFSGNQQGELTMIKIYVDEPDIEDFQFIIVLNECNPATELELVSVNSSWEGYQLKIKDYQILPGITLTVTGQIAMAEEADIFVNRGAKIVIDGGRLTGTCKALWNGIDLWGDARYYQVPEYQGSAEIINSGMIEYADTAIATARNNGIYTIPSGGIIYCNNAILKDNYVGICLLPYTNPQGPNIPNFCRFKKSEFKITNDYYDLDDLISTAPKCAIQMDGVKGLVFEGCRFINESSADKRSRGSGIINMNAGYYVKSVCENDTFYPCRNYIPSRFEGWDYGIKSLNEWSSKTLTVDSVDFIDNYRGIYMSMTTDATIIRNRFELNADDDYFSQGDTLIGIYTDHCNRYFIEENKITGVNPADYKLAGMHILNSSPYYNEIYNDSLINLTYGIIAAGENRNKEGTEGLCIKCNDFIDCMTDVYVTPMLDENGNPIITDNTGISLFQGEPGDDNAHAAGNTFSESADYNYVNDIGCKYIIYTYHGINYTNKIIYPEPVYGEIARQPDEDAQYTKEESCPSHLGGGINPTLEKGKLITETCSISAYQDTLQMYVDGGDTEGLNFEVRTSQPEEALDIRQELMNESPYLSDTVLISAIEKENVLPDAMIRDVLVANPQSPKSQKIMVAMDQRQVSLPDYMIEEIMQGLNTFGAKEILEQKIGKHMVKKENAWKNLNLHYKNDTTNYTSSCDSLIQLLQMDNDLPARYNLAFLFIDQSDSLNAFNILNTIPDGFDLTDSELLTHDLYLNLFGVLWRLKSDTTGLDSLQIQTLFNLSSYHHNLPGVYAMNLLIKEKLLNYCEPVYLPALLKSYPAAGKEQEADNKSKYFVIYPNPSRDYFIVQYDLTDQPSAGTLFISDLYGKELKAIRLKDIQNQIIVPVEEYSTGVYLIRLYSGNHLIDSQKIIITK